MTRPSILVVEDEALIADDLQRTLVKLGYDVCAVVADGRSAISAAAAHQPSLMLMDIKLQGEMDGINAARVIREGADAPVVFLTSHSDSSTLSRASAVRPSGYVVKPFAERDLRVAIELALHKHQVESALRTQERWFSTTINSIGDGVLATDVQLAVRFLNRAAERLLGLSSADAAGQPLGAVLPLRDAQGALVESPAAAALARREAVHAGVLATLVHPDGHRSLVDFTAAPIIDEAGQLLGAVVVFEDVTDRTELEQRVVRSERLAALGTLSAGLCHELNSPLTVVMSNLAFGLSGLPEATAPQDVRQSLRDAQEAATHINHIVQDLRAFAHPGAGAASQGEVQLQDVIRQALKLTAHVTRDHALVQVQLGPTPAVRADATRLVQVFVNLLANAAQAMPGETTTGRIDVRLSTDAQGAAVVEVQDQGSGIRPENLSRVFDPFFTTKPPGAGMGMGLSICNAIVEEFGGRIEIESEVEVGTTFRVRLPAAGQAPLTRRLASASGGLPPGPSS